MPDAPRIAPRPKSDPVALDRLQAVVLAGGPSSGNPLTKFDARASLKFGASYRLIDFPMANIINSGFKCLDLKLAKQLIKRHACNNPARDSCKHARYSAAYML